MTENTDADDSAESPEPVDEADIPKVISLAGQLGAVCKALMQERISHQEAVEMVAAEMAECEGVVMREGPLISQGRLSFGRKREGQEGVAIFIPTDGLQEDQDEKISR